MHQQADICETRRLEQTHLRPICLSARHDRLAPLLVACGLSFGCLCPAWFLSCLVLLYFLQKAGSIGDPFRALSCCVHLKLSSGSAVPSHIPTETVSVCYRSLKPCRACSSAAEPVAGSSFFWEVVRPITLFAGHSEYGDKHGWEEAVDHHTG